MVYKPLRGGSMWKNESKRKNKIFSFETSSSRESSLKIAQVFFNLVNFMPDKRE